MDPNPTVSDKYWSKPEDLERLDCEHQEILKMTQNYNKSWKRSWMAKIQKLLQMRRR